MRKKTNNVNIEFGNQLGKYLKYFGLIEADIARLTKLSTYSVTEVLEGQKGIVLKTAEEISSVVFNIRYFELGNPQFPLPKKRDLPTATQDAIAERKKKGTPKITRNTELNLPSHVNIVLKSGQLALEFTSSDILNLLPDNIKNQIKSTRITDLFKKGELKDKVEETGIKRGREKVYRLK